MFLYFFSLVFFFFQLANRVEGTNFDLPEIDVSTFVRSNFTNYDWAVDYAKQRGVFLGSLLLVPLIISLVRCFTKCCFAKYCTACSLFRNNLQKYLVLGMLAGGVVATTISSQIYSAQLNNNINNRLQTDVLASFPLFSEHVHELTTSLDHVGSHVFGQVNDKLATLTHNISTTLETVNSIRQQVQFLREETTNTTESFDKQALFDLDTSTTSDQTFFDANQTFFTTRNNIDDLWKNFNTSSQLQSLEENIEDIQSTVQNIFTDHIVSTENKRNQVHQGVMSLGYIVSILVFFNLFWIFRQFFFRAESVSDDKPRGQRTIDCCLTLWLQIFLWITSFAFSFYFVVQDGGELVCQVSRFLRNDFSVLIPDQQTVNILTSCFETEEQAKNPLHVNLTNYFSVGNFSRYNADVQVTDTVEQWQNNLQEFQENLLQSDVENVFNFSSVVVDQALTELNNKSQQYETTPIIYTRSNIDVQPGDSTYPQHQETIQALVVAQQLVNQEREYELQLANMQQHTAELQTTLTTLHTQTVAIESQLHQLLDPQDLIDQLQHVIDNTSCSFLGEQYIVVENDICDNVLGTVSSIVVTLFVGLVFLNLLSCFHGCKVKG